MAYHEVAMWEILNVLERLTRRETKVAITRATGRSRSTVRRYEREARALGWTPDGPARSAAELEALAAEIGRRLSPARDREAGEIERVLLGRIDEIRQWLTPAASEKRGLRLTKVQQLLTRDGLAVPYSSLHRFAVKHCGFGARHRLTVRVADVAPGELAEIDFGRLGLVPDPTSREPQRRRVAWALIVLLVHSRHQYVHVTFTQTVQAVIDGLEDAWAFFGGVTQRVVLDNLRAAITKADRYDPIFQRTFEEYARYRAFVIDPAPVRTPTGKPHVERGVPYVRDNFFRGETWRDLADVQVRVRDWVCQTAGTRVHGTTRQHPLAVFENVERQALTPLTRERFDPPRWAHCTVHPDHHLSFGKALYSVPTRFVGRGVWVRGDRTLVRIYADRALIKTHATQAPGGRATDHDDYPPERTSYTLRDPQRIIRQAESHGVHVGRFAAELLAGIFPWAKLRQAQRLLRLGDTFGWARLDGACRRALAFDLLNVKRVETILRLDLEHGPDLESEAVALGEVRVYPLAPPSAPRFARAAESFVHPSVHPSVHRLASALCPEEAPHD
jgi:Integrase core domain